MKIAITGHRPNKLGNDYNLTSPLIQKIDNEITKNIKQIAPTYYITGITGMTLGIDTLFAKICIKLKMPFIAAIPCLNHDSKWIDKSRKIYHDILANPLCTIKLVTNDVYSNRCMQLRNEWMVDNCDILIAVWNKSEGGTANCVRYALKELDLNHLTDKYRPIKQVIQINPKEL